MGLLHPKHKVPFKKPSVAGIFRLKNKLIADTDIPIWIGKRVPAEEIQYLCEVVLQYLPSADRDALTRSLLSMCGGILTKQLWRRIAWVLAANYTALQLGVSVSFWKRQTVDEWVVVQCTEAQERQLFNGSPGGEITFKVLTGTPATLDTKAFWSLKFARFLARKCELQTNKDIPGFKKISELVGMRFIVLIEAARSEERPSFFQVDIDHALLTYNRELVKRRNRIGFQCPFDFQHKCFVCPVGYDQCGCGTHPRTYEKLWCIRCCQLNYADPNLTVLRICVDCYKKEHYRS